MEVLALLPPALLSHLKVVLGPEHSLVAAEGTTALGEAIQLRPVDVVVVDPSSVGAARLPELGELVARYPTLPFVAYTTLAASALRPLVELSKRGVEQVVLFRYDDETRRFRDLLERQSASVLTETMLDLLAPRLSRTTPPLVRAVERLFRQPHGFFTVGDLARAAGMTVRTVYRQCETAGLASPRLLVIGARLLRAYQFMRDPGHSIEDVAAKLGYSAPRIFTRHARMALGATPRELRRGLSPLEVLERLQRVLVPDEPGPAADVA